MRTQLVEDGFFLPSKDKLGEFELRLFSGGSLRLARKLGFQIFDGRPMAEIPPDIRERDFYGFLYMQSQDLDAVLTAAQDPELFWRTVDRFTYSVPLELVPALGEKVNAVVTRAGAAAAFEVEPKPGAGDGPQPEGNS